MGGRRGGDATCGEGDIVLIAYQGSRGALRRRWSGDVRCMYVRFSIYAPSWCDAESIENEE